MSLRDIPLKTEYRSLLNNVVETFYTPVLSESVLYKRAVGFFSSSALIELSAGILGLVKMEGRYSSLHLHVFHKGISLQLMMDLAGEMK